MTTATKTKPKAKKVRMPKRMTEREELELAGTHPRACDWGLSFQEHRPEAYLVVHEHGGPALLLWWTIYNYHAELEWFNELSPEKRQEQADNLEGIDLVAELAQDWGLTADQVLALYKRYPDGKYWEHRNVRAMYEAVFGKQTK